MHDLFIAFIIHSFLVTTGNCVFQGLLLLELCDIIFVLCSGTEAFEASLEDRGKPVYDPLSVLLINFKWSGCKHIKILTCICVLLQPASPEVPLSAVALSETGAAIAWPSLGAAKWTQKKKQSTSAPATPVSRKVIISMSGISGIGNCASSFKP